VASIGDTITFATGGVILAAGCLYRCVAREEHLLAAATKPRERQAAYFLGRRRVFDPPGRVRDPSLPDPFLIKCSPDPECSASGL